MVYKDYKAKAKILLVNFNVIINRILVINTNKASMEYCFGN
jgi:hypothetical protein